MELIDKSINYSRFALYILLEYSRLTVFNEKV